MFNLLISGQETAWESGQRMGMRIDRFLEFSGDECDGICREDANSLKRLEGISSLLIYESCLETPYVDVVRVGQLRDIRISPSEITFRLTESGQLPRDKVYQFAPQLQLDQGERNRTHWAVKDGEIPQDLMRVMTPTPKRYEIVLSFAGEDRGYVERVADFLQSNGVAVFYDRYEATTLWGKDLVEHFDGVYRLQARYCVMFISRHYAEKIWATHERRAAFARALVDRSEYVLPVRFDNSEIPGLSPTVGYIDISDYSSEQLGSLILQKLGKQQRLQ